MSIHWKPWPGQYWNPRWFNIGYLLSQDNIYRGCAHCIQASCPNSRGLGFRQETRGDHIRLEKLWRTTPSSSLTIDVQPLQVKLILECIVGDSHRWWSPLSLPASHKSLHTKGTGLPSFCHAALINRYVLFGFPTDQVGSWAQHRRTSTTLVC